MIVVSLVSPTVSGMLKGISDAEKRGADLIELRIDCLNEVTLNDLKRLISKGKCGKIVTCRRATEGGNFRASEKERLFLLKKACSLGAHYVDLELDVDIASFDASGSKVICSYHDFSETPDIDDLVSILDDCVESGASVFKIVTLANSYGDNVTILNFLEAGQKKVGDGALVSFCMGEKGRLSRVLCTHFGSAFTYCSLESGLEAASGQVDIDTCRLLKAV